MNHTLEADSIQLELGDKIILSDIYIKCQTGRITGLLGRNGQGKTCLMNIIYGNLNPSYKSIRLDRTPINKNFKKKGLIAYLPQHNFIPRHLSLKRIFADFDINYSDFQRTFPEFSDQYLSPIKNLSAGQSRLIEVYVIVKSKTKFSMLDEPFTHLMPLHIEKMIEIVHTEKSVKGILICDHLYKYIMDLADDLYMLANGKTSLIKDKSDEALQGYARF